MLTALQAFGLVAGAASIIGLALAIVYAGRAAERSKALVYEAQLSPFPLASAKSLADYNLSVVFRATTGKEERIEDAYLQYLRLANLGREPIRRGDIAPANPLRLQVEGARILDISLEAVHREVSNLTLGPLKVSGDTATVAVTFDFLDFQDGALIKILTSEVPDSASVVGDIVGMPDGIKTAAELSKRNLSGIVGGAVSFIFYLSALALTPFTFRWVTGSWENVWILVLPFVALIVPGVIIAVVGSTIWPKGKPTFPRELIGRRRLRSTFMFGDEVVYGDHIQMDMMGTLPLSKQQTETKKEEK